MNTHFKHLERVSRAVMAVELAQLDRATALLVNVKKNDGIVWLIGNGGSSSTASHFANDLLKMCGIRAISIPDLTPAFLAYGNDTLWDNMFWGMVGGLSRANDVLVAISCSGESANVVKVVEHFSLMHTIVLTGDDPHSAIRKAGAYAVICVPDDDIKVQEDVHLAVCHAIVAMLSG